MSLRHALQIKKSGPERRLETRFAYNEPVKVTLLDESEQYWFGQTLDISASGMSFSVPVSLPVGSLVKLEVPDGMVLGEVRHCRLNETPERDYKIGLSIEHVLFGWMEFYQKARAMEMVCGDSDLLTAAPELINSSPR